jgi:hypothetical protein
MEIDDINAMYNTEFTNRLLENKHIFSEIYDACNKKFTRGCGSYLFDGQSYTYSKIMYEKQELLYNSVKSATTVLEIGTYMGHSLLIMLLANPSLKITCIDISDEFTGPAVRVLNKYFNNAITFIHSDSLAALSKITNTFDFFHIDGHHDVNYITKEFNIIKHFNKNTSNILRIIFDDQDCLVPLQDFILSNYKVLTHIIPTCKWNNVYFELQL